MKHNLLVVLTAASLAACASAQVISVDAARNCGASDPDGPTLTLVPGLYNLFPLDGAFNVWGEVIGCGAEGGDCAEGWIWFVYASINGGPAILLPEHPGGRWATPALALETSPVGVFRIDGPGPATVKFFLFDSPCSDNLGLETFEVRAACPSDFTGDGFVDFFDYDDYVACFETGACRPGQSADFNGDGFLDFFDFDDFVTAFETGC